MIELKRAGEVCVLVLRREGTAFGTPQQIYQQARPEDVAVVVNAGDPKITGRLRELGWVKTQPESKAMAEAGAELVHAATNLLTFVDRVGFEQDQDAAAANDLGGRLQAAINNYTDNVAPPEDGECVHDWIGDTNECRKCGGPLRCRDVLPGEIDEDPEQGTMFTEEREAARRLVHAAAQLIRAHLRNTGAAIAHSRISTETNDAIHDWLALQPQGAATTATCEFIEKVMGVRCTQEEAFARRAGMRAAEAVVRSIGDRTFLQPGAFDPKGFDLPSPKARRAGGITAEEFAEGVSKLPKPPKLPTFDPPNDDMFGTVVAKAAFWVLDHLWPKPKAER